MLEYITDPAVVSDLLTNKTIDAAGVKDTEYHGLTSIMLSLADGSMLIISCREKNGGAILEVEKRA
jgi:hypothetical protein